MEVDITMGTCMITEHITEDALVSRLQDGSMVLPLYIHSSVAQGPTRQARAHSYQGEWETRLRQLARFRQPLGEASGGLVRRFEGVDAVEGLLRAVKQDNCLQDDVEFSVVCVGGGVGGGDPHPVAIACCNTTIPTQLSHPPPNRCPATVQADRPLSFTPQQAI